MTPPLRALGWSRAARGTALAAGLTACSGPQHALSPGGPAAAEIASLWWVMFTIAAAVSVIVAVLFVFAIRRARARGADDATGQVNGRMLVLAGGVVVPALILFAVLAYSYQVGTRIYPLGGPEPDALTIEVVGHQFWWEVRYPGLGVSTANEIHIPAGRQVRVLVTSPDVIHSFWIPRLHGKMDMIPGHTNELWLRAYAPGAYRGQCAEYCGMAHALMALWVIALPPDGFREWIDRRRDAGAEPLTGAAQRGREVFAATGCDQCHGTRGEPLPPGRGQVGPDLSDLASRRSLAAGTLPNTADALARWIADPQRIKPGSHMPATPLPQPEMDALVTYLRSLR